MVPFPFRTYFSVSQKESKYFFSYHSISEVEAKKPKTHYDTKYQHIFFPLNSQFHPTFPLRNEMEGKPTSAVSVTSWDRSEVDTTRPFRSVKEAVAVFGERFQVNDTCSHKTNSFAPTPIYAITASKPLYSASSSPRSYSSSSSRFNPEREDDIVILNSVKKLETELKEVKRELMILKGRETETEIAVASLNAELHRGMSKLAEIEAGGVAKGGKRSTEIAEQFAVIRSERWGEERTGFKYLPSLAEALNLRDMEEKYGGRSEVKLPKLKPIVPLIGDLFSKKKKVSADFNNSLYSRTL